MSENPFDAPQESTAVLSETTLCVPWWRLALITVGIDHRRLALPDQHFESVSWSHDLKALSDRRETQNAIFRLANRGTQIMNLLMLAPEIQEGTAVSAAVGAGAGRGVFEGFAACGGNYRLE